MSKIVQWTTDDFGDWTLSGLWSMSDFSSLSPGSETLWFHKDGTGRFPNQTANPNYASARGAVRATSPAVDLSLYDDSDIWSFRLLTVWRPNHIHPLLNKEEQMPEVVELWADPGDGGALVYLDTLEQPFHDPPDEPRYTERSRVTADADDDDVGADGLWWYAQPSYPRWEAQDALLGKSGVKFIFLIRVEEMDETGYGVGVDALRVDILRSPKVDANETPFSPILMPPSSRRT